MTLYIYMQVKPIHEVTFGAPLSKWLKTLKDEVIMIEADNHSESFLVNQCLPLILKAKQVILHSEVQENEAVGALKSIFEKLRKTDKPVLSLVNGSHRGLSSMLKLMKVDSKGILDSDEAKPHISRFLKLGIDFKN